MNADSDEFSTRRVPRDRSIAWWRIAMINVLFSVSLPTLITGMDLANQTTWVIFLTSTLVGSCILTLIGIPTSLVGCRTRFSSYMLARIAFGASGSTLLNLAFALSLIGWFGLNLNLFGDSMARLFEAQLGYRPARWPAELGAGILIIGTTLVGLKAINRLSMLIVPVLLGVCAMLLVKSLARGSVMHILAQAPTAGIPFGDAVSAIVGGYIVGAVIMPDTCRFIEPAYGAVWTAVLTYSLSNAGIMLIGGFAALALKRTDMLDLMLAMGLGAAAFAIVIGSSWLLNALNLYSAALSVDAALPRLSRRATTLLCGTLGTLAAFLNILDHLLSFLFYLSIVFVPVASIILIDVFWLRRADYVLGEGTSHAFEPPALAAWATGAAVALAGSKGFIRLTGVAALDALMVTGLLYVILRRYLPAYRTAVSHVDG
ncbi:MAG TPA: cytosine permease [Steroidobacteraceae bacterium]|nr:cytosine permease [Steroidobacteraceae bacterium]